MHGHLLPKESFRQQLSGLLNHGSGAAAMSLGDQVATGCGPGWEELRLKMVEVHCGLGVVNLEKMANKGEK